MGKCGGKARRRVPLLNTQCRQKSADNGQCSVLTLDSLPTLLCAGYSVKLIFDLVESKLAQGLEACDCKHDAQSTAFWFATQYTMRPEFSGKWGTEVF